MQYHAIPCNTMQYHAIPCNTMQYNAIPCNTMQYHASLITADGAYHCPVGSIMAIFIIIWERNLLPRMKQHNQTIGYFKHVRYIWAWGCFFLCSLPHFVTELSQQRRWVIVLCLDGNPAPEEIFFPTSDFGRKNFWLLVAVELFCFCSLLNFLNSLEWETQHQGSRSCAASPRLTSFRTISSESEWSAIKISTKKMYFWCKNTIFSLYGPF